MLTYNGRTCVLFQESRAYDHYWVQKDCRLDERSLNEELHICHHTHFNCFNPDLDPEAHNVCAILTGVTSLSFTAFKIEEYGETFWTDVADIFSYIAQKLQWYLNRWAGTPGPRMI